MGGGGAPAALTMSARRLPVVPVFLAAALLCLLTLIGGTLLGDSPLPVGDALGALLRPGAHPDAAAIVWELRLPRVCVAALVGAALAVAGAALQALTGNPLADPYLVGVASGASVGAGLAILLGLGGALLPAFAFVGAAAAVALVLALSRRDGRLDLSALLLAGVVVGAFLAALVHLLLALAGQDQARILGWLMGYLGDADWSQAALLAPIVAVGAAALSSTGRSLDALAFGEDTARSLGVPVERYKVGALAAIALLTAAAVAVSGVIGFVGLAVPHLCRNLIGPPNRRLIPLCALVGAALLALADLLARAGRPGQPLPVGVITALAGAPVFVALLRRR